MRVLVTFAVEAEFAPWMASRKFRHRTLLPDHHSGGLQVYESEIGPNTVWVLLTGIACAAIGSTILLELRAKEAGVDAFVSSGLAGALRKEHLVGEVIAPKRIGTRRDADGVEATAKLVERARESGAKVVGALLTSDRVIETGDEKQRLAMFADAVDMESNTLMSAFDSGGIPCVTLRAISDESDEDLPIDFGECLTAEGNIRPLPLFQRIARDPFKIPALVRFGLRSKRAAGNLANFLDGFVGSLTPEIVKTDLGVAAQ